LVQSERIPQFPMILYGRKFWDGLVRWMRSQMLDKHSFIGAGDLNLFTIVDRPQEAVGVILDYERRVGPPEIVSKAFA
jgi:hypothetical protein